MLTKYKQKGHFKTIVTESLHLINIKIYDLFNIFCLKKISIFSITI